ncbi:hypothetical protein BHE74_00030074 [Ensete ventricosum]|nr:hypothetical protein BHE74_00030074 [Ensete ventricosum]
MIGGITRFKKHLASKRGEIKGCEAVPKEVREIMAHHLATRKPRRPNKRRRKIAEGTSAAPASTNLGMESDASDPDMIDAGQEKGLLDCIETLEPDLTAQDNITKHKSFYEDALGDFSRPMALRGRETLHPGDWIDDPGMLEMEGINLLDATPIASIDKVANTSDGNLVTNDLVTN